MTKNIVVQLLNTITSAMAVLRIQEVRSSRTNSFGLPLDFHLYQTQILVPLPTGESFGQSFGGLSLIVDQLSSTY
ncbi:uncharacterized protein AKAW2_41339A [Aspergillus luchuensis]|uniref:Uncharacterized protein n=1 Tax=Aspergillus kawachii TaxID=1069201 RepID=A0A7R7WAZ8_ASPKA|nr:uncharacterized protein AKAW2_41339A [Aspergillus luchuensis]BCR99656.1 hypothetical protein AKAW2_41339A [Aspergillus luchuensis]